MSYCASDCIVTSMSPFFFYLLQYYYLSLSTIHPCYITVLVKGLNMACVTSKTLHLVPHGPCRLVSWLKRGLFHTFAVGRFIRSVKHYVSTRSQCASLRLYPSLQLSACTSFDTDWCVFGEVIAVQSVPTTEGSNSKS